MTDEPTTKTSREIADEYVRDKFGLGINDIEHAADSATGLEVTIDGETWFVTSDYARYDAAHAVAGALLAGAERVAVERHERVDDAS